MIKIDLPNQFIAAAVEIFLTHPDASESDLVDRISGRIGEREVAERLVELIPLAFGRIILQRAGVALPDKFRRMTEDGGLSPECPLTWEALWRPTVEFASKAEARLTRDDFLAVASRSAEFDAVNNACHAGSKPGDLVLAAPIFTRAASLPPARKRWWQFAK